MSLALQPVRVATGEEADGFLVFSNGWLVAVLTRLSEMHEDIAGHWFLEVWFGRLYGRHPTFADLDVAKAWISSQLKQRVMS